MKQEKNLLGDLPSIYSAVLCDILDTLGFPHQALPNTIRPLSPKTSICGKIYTARAVPVCENPKEPYKLEIEIVDRLQKGDVLVVDAGFDSTCGLWGELLTTACKYKGVAGVVMTACTRDMWKIKSMDFPVYGIGYHPADSKGRLDFISLGAPINISGVQIKTGDYLAGDIDGVAAVPSEVGEMAIRLAKEKISGENRARLDLEKGVPMKEVFQKYGIL